MNPQPTSPEAQQPAPAADALRAGVAGTLSVRGGTIRGGGYLLGLGLGLLAAPLIVHELGIAGFGRYLTIVSLVALSSGLAEAGIGAIGLREYVVRDSAERELLMRELLGMRLVLSLAGGVLAVVFAALAGYGSALVLGTAIAAVGGLLTAVQALLVVPLMAALRATPVTMLELLRQVIVLALIAALAVSGAGIVAFLTVIPAATLAQLLATAALTRGMRPLLPRFSMRQWRLLLGRTLPFAIATAVWVVYFRVAMVAISLISSPLQTGYFATSYRIIEVLIALPYVLVSTVFPVFARAAQEQGARLAAAADRVLAVALLVGVGLALTLAFSAPTVVRLIAGSAGRPAAGVLEIQAIALVPAFLGTTASFALFSLARYRSMLLAISAGLVANLVLLPILIDADAARGAAIATVAAEGAMAACLLVMLARARPGMRGPLRSAGPVAIAAAAACGAALLAPLPPLGQATLAGAVYLTLLTALGVLPGDVGRALRGGG